MKNAAMMFVATVLTAPWIWGIVLFAKAGNATEAVLALMVPPYGVLHGVGLL